MNRIVVREQTGKQRDEDREVDLEQRLSNEAQSFNIIMCLCCCAASWTMHCLHFVEQRQHWMKKKTWMWSSEYGFIWSKLRKQEIIYELVKPEWCQLKEWSSTPPSNIYLNFCFIRKEINWNYYCNLFYKDVLGQNEQIEICTFKHCSWSISHMIKTMKVVPEYSHSFL